MKKFIRNRTTGAFLAKDGTWTMDISLACEFKTSVDLYEAVVHFGLTNVDEVFQVGGEPSKEWDIVLHL